MLESQRYLPEEVINATAQHIAIASIKYSDLSMNRQHNYKFTFDKMLAMNGNTASYLLYAYARISSILRKSSSINSEKIGIQYN